MVDPIIAVPPTTTTGWLAASFGEANKHLTADIE